MVDRPDSPLQRAGARIFAYQRARHAKCCPDASKKDSAKLIGRDCVRANRHRAILREYGAPSEGAPTPKRGRESGLPAKKARITLPFPSPVTSSLAVFEMREACHLCRRPEPTLASPKVIVPAAATAVPLQLGRFPVPCLVRDRGS